MIIDMKFLIITLKYVTLSRIYKCIAFIYEDNEGAEDEETIS